MYVYIPVHAYDACMCIHPSSYVVNLSDAYNNYIPTMSKGICNGCNQKFEGIHMYISGKSPMLQLRTTYVILPSEVL